jgi:iron complex transport system substrate-binding protein
MKSTWFRRACLGLLLGALGLAVDGREITDMAGRKVTIPDQITKIYAAQPYTNVLLYMLAPDLLLGLQPGCLPFRDQDRRFLRPEVAKLPEIETQLGGGENPQTNVEAILAMHPDFALANGGKGSDDMKMNPTKLEARMAKIGLPVVFVDVRRLSDYPAGIEFLGTLLGREAHAQRLSAYARRALAEVDKMVAEIPPEQRVRVYYAESADGLVTESDGSFHTEAIRVAGGAIVHHGDLKTHVGMEKVSLEQILLYNPDVIISQEPEFVANVYQDTRWKDVKAVVNHRVYSIPRSPFDWIDRPPCVTRILGVQWLAKLFYPDRCTIDIRKEVKDFHRIFMGMELTDADVDELLK